VTFMATFRGCGILFEMAAALMRHRSGVGAVPELNELLIIQAGHAPDDMRLSLGDISDWYVRALADLDVTMRIVRPFLGESLPSSGAVCAAIITGSWAMVSDREGWSEETAAWIREAMTHSLPMLGICYGHQLMAHALGGRVDYHPGGVEIGVHAVSLSDEGRADPFFNAWPDVFAAPLTHLQTIAALPPGAVRLASSEHDSYQIVRYGPNAISVQFHPEFDRSILSACIRRRAAKLEQQGFIIQTLLAGAVDTLHARKILIDFVRMHTACDAIEQQAAV
jgi:GMP synthase (glutamine-hydrolysing)